MAESLDMALDDIIRKNRRYRELNDGPTAGRVSRPPIGAGGPSRRLPNRALFRDASPYTAPLPMAAMAPIWEQHIAEYAGETTDPEAGTKLYISNLDYGVSNNDLMLLFSSVGDLQRYSIHCDKSGRSKGTAEVVFKREVDAIAAIKRYNNVQLDGKPMMIEIVGKNLISHVPLLPIPNSILGSALNFLPRGQRLGVKHAPGSNIGCQLPWERTQAKASQIKPSAEDLDAELEKYHLEARKAKRSAQSDP
ncbi:hypothetical protein SAY86_017765 [Trapa natans]|uniref:RRM domain-containing protein n=1 Tax=Trapa natans TaxID=22666 RepID=A0AAN7M5P5_TRANT|nr:hypothetical protein SAY86_017765 [Trapa natans]